MNTMNTNAHNHNKHEGDRNMSTTALSTVTVSLPEAISDKKDLHNCIFEGVTGVNTEIEFHDDDEAPVITTEGTVEASVLEILNKNINGVFEEFHREKSDYETMHPEHSSNFTTNLIDYGTPIPLLYGEKESLILKYALYFIENPVWMPESIKLDNVFKKGTIMGEHFEAKLSGYDSATSPSLLSDIVQFIYENLDDDEDEDDEDKRPIMEQVKDVYNNVPDSEYPTLSDGVFFNLNALFGLYNNYRTDYCWEVKERIQKKKTEFAIPFDENNRESIEEAKIALVKHIIWMLIDEADEDYYCEDEVIKFVA